LTSERIGVGEGKFLGVERNFARILPNLPVKYFKISDLQKRKETLHVNSGAMWFSKKEKLFMSIRVILFLNQSMLGAIFAQIFREF